MKKQTAIQVFTVIAIAVGLLISFCTPENNAEAIFSMVTLFMGYAIKDLFNPDEKKEEIAAPVYAPISSPSTADTSIAVSAPIVNAPPTQTLEQAQIASTQP